MSIGQRLTAAVVAGVLIVFLFLWKHDADARRDGRIQELDGRIAQQRVVIDSLMHRSDSISKLVDVAATTFAHADTVWRRHSDTVARTVTQIINETTLADTTKISELAALVLETKRKADSTIKAAEIVNQLAVVDLRLSFASERAGWETQRADMATEIALLKKQSRHWGLGAALGYGAQRASDGTIRAGPVLSVGIVYRY